MHLIILLASLSLSSVRHPPTSPRPTPALLNTFQGHEKWSVALGRQGCLPQLKASFTESWMTLSGRSSLICSYSSLTHNNLLRYFNLSSLLRQYTHD